MPFYHSYVYTNIYQHDILYTNPAKLLKKNSKKIVLFIMVLAFLPHKHTHRRNTQVESTASMGLNTWKKINIYVATVWIVMPAYIIQQYTHTCMWQ